MSVRYMTRRAALKVPRIRRYYEFASGLAVEHDALRREIASQVESFEAEKAELDTALDQAYAALELERDLVSQLTEEGSQLTEEASQLTEKVSQLTEKVSQLTAEVSRLTTERDEARRTAGTERQAIEAERQAFAADSAQAKAMAEDYDSLKLQVYVLRSDFQRSVVQIDKLRTEAQTAERELERCKLELGEARAEAVSRADKLRTEAQTAERELERCKLELGEARAEAVSRVDKLRTQAQTAERELERCKLQLGEVESRYAELHAQEKQREMSARELMQKIQSEATARLLEAENRLQVKAEVERKQAEADVQRLQAEAETQSHRCAELAAQGSLQASRISELQAQLGGSLALRSDLEESQARLLGRMSLVSADLVHLRQAMRDNRPGTVPHLEQLRRTYLDLLEAALTGRLYEDVSIAPWIQGYDADVRTIGRDWPSLAQTMIGTVRMRNIRTLAETILQDGIDGDFLEAGVWRGGACIYMRGILAAYSDLDRRVFVADSFAGLPLPSPELYPADLNDKHHTFKQLVVSLEEVKGNFARFGFLDNQVAFLKGWFKDTLPQAPIGKLALLRLDGDMYSSTIETLEALYAKVAVGGFVVIDDYILPACRQAVEDFRSRFRIVDEINDIDGAGVFWRKSV